MSDRPEVNSFEIAFGISVGGADPILVAGPCVIEGEDMLIRHAESVAEIAAQVGMPFLFKASYDKANRTSLESYRGPGLEEGLRMLQKIRDSLNVPILTDAHSISEIEAVGEVVDVIQIPAFLCRQTDLLIAAARTGKTVNIKKGQFIAPGDVANIIRKVTASGGSRLMLTERGSCFGYNRLVVDFAGMLSMRELGWPVIFDATHSVQIPGGLGDSSGGESHYAPYLAKAAAAIGVDGLFVEVHEDPGKALSDGPNMIPLNLLESVLEDFLRVRSTAVMNR